MRTTVTRRYTFEAAHFLPMVPKEHKCSRMHGHNYTVDVSAIISDVSGEGGVDKIGFVIDFWDLDNVVDPLVESIDHRVLNEQTGLENPTAENIAAWFKFHIDERLPDGLHCFKVRVYEVFGSCWADVEDDHET